jgi:hypothetical protein
MWFLLFIIGEGMQRYAETFGMCYLKVKVDEKKKYDRVK